MILLHHFSLVFMINISVPLLLFMYSLYWRPSLLLLLFSLQVISNCLRPLRLYVAHQASWSVGFSRQEYWSGLPFSFSRGSSWHRDQTCVSWIGRRILYPWVTSEARRPFYNRVRAKFLEMAGLQALPASSAFQASWFPSIDLFVCYFLKCSLCSHLLASFSSSSVSSTPPSQGFCSCCFMSLLHIVGPKLSSSWFNLAFSMKPFNLKFKWWPSLSAFLTPAPMAPSPSNYIFNHVCVYFHQSISFQDAKIMCGYLLCIYTPRFRRVPNTQ